MQARVTRTTASLGLTIAASGTFWMRTSWAPNMTVARMVIDLRFLCFSPPLQGEGWVGMVSLLRALSALRFSRVPASRYEANDYGLTTSSARPAFASAPDSVLLAP